MFLQAAVCVEVGYQGHEHYADAGSIQPTIDYYHAY